MTPPLQRGSPITRGSFLTLAPLEVHLSAVTGSSADPLPWPASPFPDSASTQRPLVLPSLGFSRTTLYLGALPWNPAPPLLPESPALSLEVFHLPGGGGVPLFLPQTPPLQSLLPLTRSAVLSLGVGSRILPSHPGCTRLCPPPPSPPRSPYADIEASPLRLPPKRSPPGTTHGPGAQGEPLAEPTLPDTAPSPSHSPTAPGPHSPASLRSRSRTCRQRHLTAAQSKRDFFAVPPIRAGRAPATVRLRWPELRSGGGWLLVAASGRAT